jgi:hypothetical protein
MSNFTLTIDTGNDAFADGNWSGEIARILSEVANDLTLYGRSAFDNGVIRVRDVNGNRVGFASLDEEV